jgi:S-adenosylmethionine hydrolase
MSGTIALLTDFGTSDTYVGVMKAVISRICPGVGFIDLTHEIPPQNIQRGAFTLLKNYRYFAAGTIFLVVVDPGVGSTRKAIAAQAGDYFFVGPDNGVLSYVLSEIEHPAIVELSNTDYRLHPVSNTFHGRDIFAPAAAHLAAGIPLHQFGPALEHITQQGLPSLQINGSQITGHVITTDHFGNLVTSISKLTWVAANQLELHPSLDKPFATPLTFSADQVTVTIGDQNVTGIRHSYSEAPKGELVALVESSGYLEIALNQGSAALQLNLAPNAQIILQIG